MERRRRNRSVTTDGTAPFLCCRTCRTRRIKCDGRRPSCGACRTGRFACGGYSSWHLAFDVAPNVPPPQNVVSIDSTIIPQARPLYRTLLSPVCNRHSLSDTALHAFDYFRYRACTIFQERGYPISWATSSISIGLQEPAVFYAMAALSLAEQSVIHVVHTTLARPMDEEKMKAALQLYSKAITCLREPLQRTVPGLDSLEPIILSCILFLVFEVNTGNHLNAIRHARGGKAILDGYLNGQDSSTPSSSGSSPSLSPPLERIQTGWSERICEGVPPVCSHSTLFSDLEISFASLEEARFGLETLTEAGEGIRGQLLRSAKNSAQNIPIAAGTASRLCLQYTQSRFFKVDEAFSTHLDEVTSGFESWGTKFWPMFHSGDFISKDLFLLQMRFFYARFTLAMCRETEERLTDHYSDEFVRTLESAERVLKHRPVVSRQHGAETSTGPVAIDFMAKLNNVAREGSGSADTDPQAQPHIGPHPPPEEVKTSAAGVFEFGILHALFIIACKCRSSSLRRKAAQLLAVAKRTEAVNSSRILSTYAETIIHLEEQQAAILTGQLGNCPDFYADEVPEHARFLDVVASPVDGEDGRFSLSCTRKAQGEERGFELLEYECVDRQEDCRLVGVTVIQAGHFS